MLRRSQIVSRRGEDRRTDDDVCQPASGLQPDVCDVTRLQARPEGAEHPIERRSPGPEPSGKAKRDRASIKHFQQRRRDDAHIKATLRIRVEPVF